MDNNEHKNTNYLVSSSSNNNNQNNNSALVIESPTIHQDTSSDSIGKVLLNSQQQAQPFQPTQRRQVGQRIPRGPAKSRTLIVGSNATPSTLQQSTQQPIPSMEMVKLCLGGEVIDIPKILTENEFLFKSVINKYAFWSLSDGAQNYLRNHLPGPIQSKEDEETILDGVFTQNKNFFFGNPITKVFKRIQTGYFGLPHFADHVQHRDHRRVLYDHYIRHYHTGLLPKLLANRHKILEKISKLHENDQLKMSSSINFNTRNLRKINRLKERAQIRSKMIFKNCSNIANSIGSSDENEDGNELPNTTILSGAESTLYLNIFSEHDLDLHQPIRPKTVKEMLKEYKHLRETETDCPSLDITDITLDEVYEKVGLSFQSERNFAQLIHKNRRSKDSTTTNKD